MGACRLDGDGFNAGIIALPVFGIIGWDDKRMGDKGNLARENELRLALYDHQRLIFAYSQFFLTLLDSRQFTFGMDIALVSFLFLLFAHFGKVRHLIAKAAFNERYALRYLLEEGIPPFPRHLLDDLFAGKAADPAHPTHSFTTQTHD